MERLQKNSTVPPANNNRKTHTTWRTTRDLTDAQRWLLRIMSEYQFGRIENLRVQDGQPSPDGYLKIVRVTRLGANGGGLPISTAAGDFELKQATRDLLDELVALSDGLVLRLEFRYGLPLLLETAAAAGDQEGESEKRRSSTATGPYRAQP